MVLQIAGTDCGVIAEVRRKLDIRAGYVSQSRNNRSRHTRDVVPGQ